MRGKPQLLYADGLCPVLISSSSGCGFPLVGTQSFLNHRQNKKPCRTLPVTSGPCPAQNLLV